MCREFSQIALGDRLAVVTNALPRTIHNVMTDTRKTRRANLWIQRSLCSVESIRQVIPLTRPSGDEPWQLRLSSFKITLELPLDSPRAGLGFRFGCLHISLHTDIRLWFWYRLVYDIACHK